MYHFDNNITYSAVLKHLSKNWNIRRQYITYLQASKSSTIQSGGRFSRTFSLTLVCPWN